MGVPTGCGCKEVYRFPRTTYPYSSCIYLLFFTAASLLFVHFLKCFLEEEEECQITIFYFARCVRKLAMLLKKKF